MTADAFFALAERLFARLHADEVLFVSIGVERSDFVRVNQARIRQAGAVQTAGLGLTLIAGQRQVDGDCVLAGDADADLALALGLLGRLRERIGHVPDDPYLHFSTEPARSERQPTTTLPDSTEAVATLLDLGKGLDLVGIWAAGDLADGLASSIGHRHWHASRSFNLDWSCFLDQDRALKASYAGTDWDPHALAGRLAEQRRQLDVLARPARPVEPGRVRAYLAPAAVEELLDMLAWGGFGQRDRQTRQSPLMLLAEGERRLSPAVTLIEDNRRGLGPGFTSEGFSMPDQVSLIEQGRPGNLLTDARSAKEYGIPVNAAAEYPSTLTMAPGDLADDAILQRLDTGLYIGNLWYCNWSDRNACRITGMTRFGTFWVDNGTLAAPAPVMRFDDSLYHLLGDRLEALTQHHELRLSAETYDGRSTDSTLLPGALVSEINLAL
jgi:predicted Zn-dependent protease